MAARLRVNVLNDEPYALSCSEAQLASLMAHILTHHGFSELQRMLARQAKTLADHNRQVLAAEGWIA